MKSYIVKLEPRDSDDAVIVAVEANGIIEAIVKARIEAGLEDVGLKQFKVTPEKENSENN